MDKLAFQLVPSVVVCLNLSAELLWVVYTLEQYAQLDADHGTFAHPLIRLPGQALVGTSPPMQQLTGSVALVLTEMLLEVSNQTNGRGFQQQPVSGIGSVRIRNGAEHVGLFVGSNSGEPWFAVIHDLSQLRALQQQFADAGWSAHSDFQTFLQLPADSDDPPFILTGDAAFAVIAVAMQRRMFG